MKTKKPIVKKKPVPATSGDWTVGVYVDNDFEPSYFPVEVDARDAAGFKKDICPLIAKSTYGDPDEQLANAKLLASAPKLLAAARDAERCLDAVMADLPTARRFAARSVMSRIRQAINRATA